MTDERLSAGDFELLGQFGLANRTEVDLTVRLIAADVRVKHQLLSYGPLEIACRGGLGFFTVGLNHETSVYLPLDLSVGLRPTEDVTFYAGPQLYGALAVDPPGNGAGFNQTPVGALAGGLVGVAFESPKLTFEPEVSLMAPVLTGATGMAVTVSLGFTTTIR